MSCCGNRKRISFPNLLDQLADLSLTAANALANAARTGQLLAEKDLVQRRIDVCLKCRHLVKTRCTVCGCWIHLKTAVKVSQCPLKLW